MIRQASHAHHYLVVFDDHTEEPLYLGAVEALASPAQRIVLTPETAAAHAPAAPRRGIK